ncbi:dihydrofolate reductase Dfr1 [Schizosaccharomyces japonicus yFS275]|uniref:Dihydrofolate reductase n=1 Tax=Schizosaccharomyces japonicus (strain yFS275 / FY16936) TaxID=402676 RepID=B6K009_SCHJY|nr:dihydrofolate reductase Dfr1 [Schizosaccharomyces japonicus yFS275]EEB06159.1 dihydrofolate reductase Dfr1 [Schizosaccharomyces japonicus yFS275]
MSKSLKVLCLHGYVQSGPVFSKKMGTVRKYLSKFMDLQFPTGPISAETTEGLTEEEKKARLSQLGGEGANQFGWFEVEDFKNTYGGWEKSLKSLDEYMTEKGPFDGIIGFSQGAGIAAWVAHLLEQGKPNPYINQPPLKFVVFIGGFKADKPEFAHFYEPKLKTPSLVISGLSDTLVPFARSMEFAKTLENPNVLTHPGQHIVPQQANYRVALRDFIFSAPSTGERTKHPRPLTLIVASASNLSIGQKNNLPWHIKDEMAYFANTTTNAKPAGVREDGKQVMNVVLMGRSCYDSLPKKNRPLKGRINVVITRNPDYNFGLKKGAEAPANLFKAPCIDTALDLLAEKYPEDGDVQIGRVFVIGGAQLYGSAMYHPLLKEILFTRIHQEFPGDTYFPIDPATSPLWERGTTEELRAIVGDDVADGRVPAKTSKNEEVELEFEYYKKDDVSDVLSKLSVKN